jgi:hypothetical protein
LSLAVHDAPAIRDTSFTIANIPPPPHILECALSHQRSGQRYISAVLAQRSPPGDTLPILFSGRIGPHFFIAAASPQICWRWDFLPLGLSRDGSSFAFSRLLLSLVKQQLVRSLAEDYVILPDGDAPASGDSAGFRLLLPAEASDSKEAAARFTLYAANNRMLIDTAVTLYPFGRSELPLHLAPLEAGSYRMQSTVTASGSSYAGACSLRVSQSRKEFEIDGQNSLLLSNFARPLQPDNREEIFQFLSSDDHIRNIAPVIRVFHLRQSWLLLGLLFGLLATEWMVRRRKGLD